MSANELKAELLERADTETQRQFAEMLAKECAKEELRAKGHQCWLFVPNPAEYEMMAKYARSLDARCPKCKKGRVVLEIFKGDVAGDSLNLVCYWGEPGCDFMEHANDYSDL